MLLVKEANGADWFGQNNGVYAIGVANEYKFTNISALLKKDIKIESTLSFIKAAIDGVLINRDRNSGETRYTLFGITDFLSYMKLYKAKCIIDNTLVRDFIPCYRKSDNEIGLYDLVNNTFYTNSGTGTFLKGNDIVIPSPDYPQPIKNVTGNNVVKIGGKNILNVKSKNITQSNWLDYNENMQTFTIKQGVGPAPVPIPIDIDLVVGDTITVSVICESGQYSGTGTNITIGTYHNGDSTSWQGQVSLPRGEDLKDRIFSSTHIITAEINSFMPFIYGNPTIDKDIVFKVQVEKNSTATPYEPYIEPIEKELNLSGKNLVDKSKCEKGALMVDGTNNGNPTFYITDYIPVTPNSKYAFSSNYTFTGSAASYCFYDKNKNYISGEAHNNRIGYVINTPSNCYYIKDCFWVGDKLGIDSTFPQLEEGPVATEYEPYYNYELAKIGDYSDLIFKNERNNPNYDNTLVENGWYKKENNYKIVLTGNENISKYQYKNTNGVTIKEVMNGIEARAIGKCTHSIKIGDYYNDNAIWAGVNNSWIY